jgi:hypothetical protein
MASDWDSWLSFNGHFLNTAEDEEELSDDLPQQLVPNSTQAYFPPSAQANAPTSVSDGSWRYPAAEGGVRQEAPAQQVMRHFSAVNNLESYPTQAYYPPRPQARTDTSMIRTIIAEQRQQNFELGAMLGSPRIAANPSRKEQVISLLFHNSEQLGRLERLYNDLLLGEDEMAIRNNAAMGNGQISQQQYLNFLPPELHYPAGSINNRENNHLYQVQQLQAHSNMASVLHLNNYDGAKEQILQAPVYSPNNWQAQKTPVKRKQGSEMESSNNKRQNTGQTTCKLTGQTHGTMQILVDIWNPDGGFEIYNTNIETGSPWFNQKLSEKKVLRGPSRLYGASLPIFVVELDENERDKSAADHCRRNAQVSIINKFLIATGEDFKYGGTIGRSLFTQKDYLLLIATESKPKKIKVKPFPTQEQQLEKIRELEEEARKRG